MFIQRDYFSISHYFLKVLHSVPTYVKEIRLFFSVCHEDAETWFDHMGELMFRVL